MTARFGRLRLALRIYVVSVTAFLGAGVAAFLLMRASRPGPPPHGDPAGAARWAASRLGDHWGDPQALSDELQALARFGHLHGTVYGPNGQVMGSSSPEPLAALTPAEREALLRTGLLERNPCVPERCEVAVALRHAGDEVGYVVLDRDMPRPPPAALPTALFLVGLGIAAAFLGSAIARPLDRLAATARELGAGHLEARTGLHRNDELGTVARAFDEMAEKLGRLLQSQTELVANVAHELRTPLARIRVALDLAEDGDAAIARESLSEIAQDLAELERLVADILAMARMELGANRVLTGSPPLHLGAVDLGAVVTACAERLRQRFPERRVEVELAPTLPTVEADAVLLRRALDNLLDNARKYSPAERAIRLRASAGDGAVVVEVIDSGEGIAPEDLERLFTPFFRADRSRARATGGVGLGLTLARRIAEAHGGTLTAGSKVGAGTTMTLTLPVAGALRVNRGTTLREQRGQCAD